MSGFDCQFTEKPPQAFQTHCPICLLVLREPFQVTCCGKSFCRLCIQRINTGGTPCPTCNEARFDSFQNKGLQQPLYGFRVFCSNKESGCDWQGELRQLDQHLILKPDKEEPRALKCVYCNNPYPWCGILYHQTSQCVERPFTCSLCEKYESTYADVVTNHSPVCKCRPVDCPNSCGTNNLQHQHLEEHVSTQCPLSYVECEFSDAGCDAKVYRKDLPSHLGENMVTHMSLLARENRQLKQQLREQQEKMEGGQRLRKLEEKQGKLEVQVKRQKDKIEEQVGDIRKLTQKLSRHEKKMTFSHVPPIDLEFPHPPTPQGVSNPFYSSIGGHKLQLEVRYNAAQPSLSLRYNLLKSEFAVNDRSAVLHVTILPLLKEPSSHKLEHKVVYGRVNEFVYGPEKHPFLFDVHSDKHVIKKFHVSQIIQH